MKFRMAVFTLGVGLATATYQGCGGVHENAGHDYASAMAQLSPEDQAGFVAFAEGFYKFANTQNCKMCHGQFQSPKFADPDPVIAYGNFKLLVSAADPASSKIIDYAGNGHCAAAPCSDPSVRPQVLSLLQSWAAAETAGNGGSGGVAKYFTATMAIPVPLPALGAAPKVLRYPLTVFNIPALSRAILEVELNQYSPGQYRVARLKIGGATAAVTLSGIHAYVKAATVTMGVGAEDPNQGSAWTSVIATVNPTTLPATLPTTPFTAAQAPVLVSNALSISAKSAADMLTIGIDTIELGATAIPSVVRFTDLVSANQQLGVFTQSCVSCHGATGAAAGLNLTSFTAASAKAALIQSRMNNAGNPMPPTGLLGATQRQVVGNWVASGAPQ